MFFFSSALHWAWNKWSRGQLGRTISNIISLSYAAAVNICHVSLNLSQTCRVWFQLQLGFSGSNSWWCYWLFCSARTIIPQIRRLLENMSQRNWRYFNVDVWEIANGRHRNRRKVGIPSSPVIASNAGTVYVCFWILVKLPCKTLQSEYNSPMDPYTHTRRHLLVQGLVGLFTAFSRYFMLPVYIHFDWNCAIPLHTKICKIKIK